MKQIIVALIIGISMIVSAWIIASGLRAAGRDVESAGSHVQSGLNAVSDGLADYSDSDDSDLTNSKSREIVFHLKKNLK